MLIILSPSRISQPRVAPSAVTSNVKLLLRLSMQWAKHRDYGEISAPT